MSATPSPLRSLLSLAWPIVLARATQAVIGFADALMVAPLGEEPLAAVTTGALNAFAFMILPMGATFIIQSFTAQLRGRGEYGATRRYAYYGFAMALAAGVLALGCEPLLPATLALFGYAPGVEAAMGTYLSIRLMSVAAAVGVEALGNWYGGLGNTRPQLVAGMVTMTANIALNYLLIEPRFGLPGYGVVGAAWASVIASWLGFSAILAGFVAGRGYAQSDGELDLRWYEMKRVLRFGLPNGANWFMEFAAFVLFVNVVVAHLGTTALAAFNVVMQLNAVSFMPAFGLGSAGAIQVGEAIGRRAHDEAVGIVWRTGKVAAVWMGSVGAAYLLFPQALVGLFDPGGASSARLLELGASTLMLSAIWQLFDAAGITLSEALRAAGDTAWCMTARLLLAWLVFVPASLMGVVHFGGGMVMAMSALIAYLALLAVAFGLRFASNRWREIDLVGAEPSLE